MLLNIIRIKLFWVVILGASVSVVGAEIPPKESASASKNPEKTPLSTLMQRKVKPAAHSLIEQGYGNCFYFKEFILGQRQAVIKQLLKVVEKGPDGDLEQEYVCAIRLLGKLRSTEAVNPLMEIIDLSYGTQDDLMPWHSPYVAALALVEIGQPSIELAHKKLLGTNERVAYFLSAWVIMKIEGKEQALARFKRLVQEQPQKAAAVYKDAIDFIESYKDSDVTVPWSNVTQMTQPPSNSIGKPEDEDFKRQLIRKDNEFGKQLLAAKEFEATLKSKDELPHKFGGRLHDLTETAKLLRLPSASKFWLENLTLRIDPSSLPKGIKPKIMNSYPAIDALVTLNSPTLVSDLVSILKRSTNEHEKRIALHSLVSVYMNAGLYNPRIVVISVLNDNLWLKKPAGSNAERKRLISILQNNEVLVELSGNYTDVTRSNSHTDAANEQKSDQTEPGFWRKRALKKGADPVTEGERIWLEQ